MTNANEDSGTNVKNFTRGNLIVDLIVVVVVVVVVTVGETSEQRESFWRELRSRAGDDVWRNSGWISVELKPWRRDALENWLKVWRRSLPRSSFLFNTNKLNDSRKIFFLCLNRILALLDFVDHNSVTQFIRASQIPIQVMSFALPAMKLKWNLGWVVWLRRHWFDFFLKVGTNNKSTQVVFDC